MKIYLKIPFLLCYSVFFFPHKSIPQGRKNLNFEHESVFNVLEKIREERVGGSGEGSELLPFNLFVIITVNKNVLDFTF